METLFCDLPALTFVWNWNHRNAEILTRVGWFKYLVNGETGALQFSFTYALFRILARVVSEKIKRSQKNTSVWLYVVATLCHHLPIERSSHTRRNIRMRLPVNRLGQRWWRHIRKLLNILARGWINYFVCFVLCFPKTVHVPLTLPLSRNESTEYPISTNVENPSNYARIWCCSNPVRRLINCAFVCSLRLHFIE